MSDHLRAERDGAVLRLTLARPEKKNALTRDMYAALAQPLKPAALAFDIHLRAAPVMRPGVPERLTAILADMRDALTDKINKGEV